MRFFNNLDETIDDRNHATDLPDDEFMNFKRQSGAAFTPKEGQFDAVDRFISKCRDDFSQSNFKPPQRSNLKADKEKALQKLRKGEDIVIKPC